MKTVLLSLAFILTAVTCFAQSNAGNDPATAAFNDAEKRLADYCHVGQGFQPGHPDLLEGIDILTTEAKMSACTLHKTMGLKATDSLYLRGFRKLETGGNEFTYLLIDFSSGQPVEKLCTATSHYIHPAGASWDAMQEIYDINCVPHKD